MESELLNAFSQEGLVKFEEGHKKFIAVLTDDEVRLLTHIHFHAGLDEDKLPNQDELEKVAKEKLMAAGLDGDDYGKYIEVTPTAGTNPEKIKADLVEKYESWIDDLSKLRHDQLIEVTCLASIDEGFVRSWQFVEKIDKVSPSGKTKKVIMTRENLVTSLDWFISSMTLSSSNDLSDWVISWKVKE